MLAFVLIYTFTSNAVMGITNEATTFNQSFTFQELQNQETIETINCEIECISNKIELEKSRNPNSAELQKFYNARGTRYFCIGMFEHALEDFNHVLKALNKSQEARDPLLAAALLGRLFCNAYQNLDEEAFDDLDSFQTYFLSKCTQPISTKVTFTNSTNANRNNQPDAQNTELSFDKLLNNNQSNDYFIQSIAEFADPNERLTPWQCKERVRGTADIMRLLTARIPNAKLAAAVNIVISQLENAMYDCCNRSHWTDCLSPIIDAYNYIRECLKKGVAIAPKIVWPGR